MSITVRVIFWGLVGVVPNPQVEQGMTVLFADPGAHHQSQSSECQIPPHISFAFLLKGECTGGNCLRIPADGSQPRIIEALRKAGNVAGGLAWLLDDEHLEVTGGVRGINPERPMRPTDSGRPIRVPTRPDHIDDLYWLPDMRDLTGSMGSVKESCLRTGQFCPIQARFKIRSGRVEACHLLHDEESVKAYTFVTSTTVKDQQQAIADAVMATYQADGDSVEIRSWAYSDNPTQDNPRVFAQIRPEGNEITLILANLPVLFGNDCMFEQHSRIFYGLLENQTQPERQAIRRKLEGVEAKVSPGSCEEYIIDLEKALQNSSLKSERDIIVFPHTSTQCDNRGYDAHPNG